MEKLVENRSPLEYLKLFFRRKWYFIVPTLAGLVLGITACFILPPAYESSTMILVEEEKIINPLIQNLAVSTTAAQRMESIREILLGWNSLSELTKKLNLDKNAKTPGQYEILIKQLKDSIDVQMRPPNIIKITYSNINAKLTQLVTQTLTDILVQKNMESQTKETDVAIKFIKEQLAIYKRKIKESEIAQLDDQLKNLLIDSTEQHPLVKELRHKISVATKELESGEYQVAVSQEPINETAKEALKVELDKIINKSQQMTQGSTLLDMEQTQNSNSSLYNILLMDKVGSTMARDINVNDRIYQMLLERLETAKITQRLEMSKSGTRYTIIDPPRLPLHPSKPNKIKVILIGLILGAFSGVGLVFGKEFLDHSFLDIEDAKQNLDLPVLGAISRITTQEEIDKEKNIENKWIILAIELSAALIFLSILISLIKR